MCSAYEPWEIFVLDLAYLIKRLAAPDAI